MTVKSLVVIPARMAASRFPGKPMVKILGTPMIGHIVKRSLFSKSADFTYVATCDREISDYVQSLGEKSVMTSDTHERATERVAEALIKIESEVNARIDIVVMVQGDEPMVDPKMIDQLVDGMRQDPTVKVLNLMVKIENDGEFEDPNAVKVVVGPDFNAIYFSREPIPTTKKGYEGPRYKQLGMIAFSRDFLLRYVQLSPTPLEIAESVDMMRVIEHGEKVKMLLTDERCLAVDVPQDIMTVETQMRKSDPWLARYSL